MDHIEDQPDDIIDLGAASAETKGPLNGVQDHIGALGVSGLSDD